MGICLIAYSLSASHLDAVLAEPALIWRVLEAEDDSSYLEQLAADNRTSLLQRLLGRAKPPRAPSTLSLADPERRELDVDKSWDGLRHCVALCAPDAANFFEGDGKIGDFEVGYGPALYVGPDTVARCAAALASLDEGTLLKAFRTADFKGVYLEALWKRQDEEAESYLLENYRDFGQFIQHCAAHRQAAILQYT